MRAEWGNAIGRISFTTNLGGLHVRHTAGASAHDSDVLPDAWRESWRQESVPASLESTGSAAMNGAGTSGVRYRGFSGTAWPEPATLAGPAWSIGYALERYGVDYSGPQPLPVPRLAVA